MNIADCTITDNQAVGGINGDLALDALGAGYGGGVSNVAASMSIANSTISGNIAQDAGQPPEPGGIGFGGGIANSSGGTMTLTDSQLLHNSTIARPGGAGPGTLSTSSAAGFAFGGGIDTTSHSTTTLVACTIAHNLAQGSAGSTSNSGGDGIGGGLGVGGSWRESFRAGQLGVEGHRWHRRWQPGPGRCAGGQGADGGNGWGGGLAVVNADTATLTASSVAQTMRLAARRALVAARAKAWRRRLRFQWGHV